MLAFIEDARAKAYALEPENNEAIALCVRAWHELGTCRYIGMCAGPIPWTATVAWIDRMGLDRDAGEVVLRVINRLDAMKAKADAIDRARNGGG